MAQVITTLKKKGDASVDIYPNIKAENIPNNAIDTTKIQDASISNDKVIDNSITKDKLDVIKNKYVVTFDLSDIDLSAYDVDGGVAYIENAKNTYLDSDDFIASLTLNYNYSKGGYFIFNNTNYVIIDINRCMYNGVEQISLFGITPTDRKRVYIPVSIFKTIATISEISTSNI